jgi:hypothetical protein
MKTADVSSNKLAIAALAAAALSIGALTTTTAAAQTLVRPPVSAAEAPVVQAVCTTTVSKAKVSKTARVTTGTTFVDVIDTQIGFIQGGSSPSCVIVSFSAEASAAANTAMVVEALLDGVVCQPDGNFFVASTAAVVGIADRAMNYVCPDVAPGNHLAKIHFRSSSGGAVTLAFRTTIVHYAK